MNIKVLIIDDEPSIRKGLRTLLSWETFGFTICGEAGTVEEGMNKINALSPDLLLLDICMPQTNGLELAAMARSEGFTGKIIILSGYSDFTYAKQAIEQGITAYLLKPIDEKELMDALDKVRNQLEEESYLYAYSSQSVKQAKQNFIMDVISGKLTIQPETRLYDLDFSPDTYQLILLYRSDGSAADALSGSLSDYTRAGGWLVPEGEHYCLLLKGKKAVFQFRILEKNPDILYCIGHSVSEVNQLPEQYRILKKLYEERFFFLKENNLLHPEMLTLELPEKLHAFDIIDYVEQFYTCIAAGSLERISMLIQEMEDYFMISQMPSGKTMRILITCYMQIITPIQSRYPQTINHVLGDDLFTNCIIDCFSLHEILSLMEKNFLQAASVIHTVTGDNIIEKICSYLELNYNRSGLKLETISEIFGYNSSYLGKIFTKEVGENFNSYLDQIRIAKAKELLATPKKIYQVAEECGFNDVEYFTKKFKKYTGLTPSSYRNSL